MASLSTCFAVLPNSRFYEHRLIALKTPIFLQPPRSFPTLPTPVVPADSGKRWELRVAINRPQFKKASGYVTQKDTIFPLLTVEETFLFSAKLKLNLPPAELSARVSSLIHEMGLSHASRSRVRDDRSRGISGGELSIGVEVIHDSKVLILEEPTSGLDSNSALQIFDLLKKMAESKERTIVLTIHQPRYRIIKLLNSILLISNGSVLHQGTVD